MRTASSSSRNEPHSKSLRATSRSDVRPELRGAALCTTRVARCTFCARHWIDRPKFAGEGWTSVAETAPGIVSRPNLQRLRPMSGPEPPGLDRARTTPPVQFYVALFRCDAMGRQMGVVEPAAPKDGCGVVQKRGGKDPKTSKTAAESRAETRANGRKNSSLPGLDARRGAEAAHKCPEGAETRTKVPKSAAKSRAETRAKGRKSCSSLPGSNAWRNLGGAN